MFENQRACPPHTGTGDTTASALAVATSDWSTQRLEAEIAALAGHLASATCRWLGLVAEFDQREGWRAWEQISCAGWLSWQCGVSLSTAHEHVRVARALQRLPEIQAAFAAGRLSFSKVRALTRIATATDEDGWVSCALGATAAQLDRLVRACLRVTRDESERRVEREKTTWRYDEDGMLVLTARLAPERGARVVAGLEQMLHAAAEYGWGSSSAEDSTSPSATDERAGCSRSDALVAMADAAVAYGPCPREACDNYQVVVHLRERRDGHAGQEAHCHIADGPSIHPETLRRETCAGGTATTIREDSHGTPLDAGRSSRAVPAGLRRAVADRAGGRCQYPGCERKAWLQFHHVVHWIDGGPTSYANLCLLCSAHHRAHHAGRYSIVHDKAAAGHFRFHLRDGTVIPHAPVMPKATGDLFRQQSARVTADTIQPDAYDRLNLDYAVAVMASGG